ncbi:MAG TPA: HD domain-containing protein [Petrotogaceae bacterium]|jgi:exopolyphosphatase/guanosine-5'-triphosphate,3'-diphosphate pyrophosphatase|nr:HD domain-containing protein [Petrotogaceae bacterium]
MSKHLNSVIAAVINIGSNAVYLKIAQIKSGLLDILEYLEYPIFLGRDTFTKGKIDFEKVDKLCDALKDYKEMVKSYRVHDLRVVATTAVRDAYNRDYILNQIKVKTGLEVEVLDDSDEKDYIYKEIIKQIDEYPNINEKKDDSLISYIGTGSLGIAVYSKGHIVFNHNIRIGSLKLSELLSSVQDKTDRFYVVVEEYLSNFTYMITKYLSGNKLMYFIGSGREIEMIASLCQAKKDGRVLIIPKESFDKVYDYIKDKTPKQLMKIYSLSEDKAEILLPSMGIYRALLNCTDSDAIYAPIALFMDSILNEMLFPEEKQRLDKKFYESTIFCAKRIGERYFYDSGHAHRVEKIAMLIFDKMKKVHGLGEKEKILLQVSSLLHDIGKYISIKKHYIHSYNIIMASDILGLNSDDLTIIANIARYHSGLLPSSEDRNFKSLSFNDRVLVAKLLSILRLADSIDRSHSNKFNDVQVKFHENLLDIVAYTSSDTVLEEMTFKRKAEFFEEVYGIKASFRKKVQ